MVMNYKFFKQKLNYQQFSTFLKKKNLSGKGPGPCSPLKSVHERLYFLFFKIYFISLCDKICPSKKLYRHGY